MNLSGIVRDNFKTIIVLGLGYWAAVTYGYVNVPEIEPPTGWGLVATAGVVVAIGAYYYADKILALLPDDEGIFIVAFEASSEAGGQVWELTEDQFEAMRVVNGTLFQWDGTSRRVYEVRDYDPDRNVAVANWRESVAGSQFAGDATVADAMDFITEIREEFEPEAEKYRRLSRRLRSVARKLDRKRLEDQQAVLDPHLAPAFDGDAAATVGDVLRESVEADLLPESMTGEEDERLTAEHGAENGATPSDGGEFVPFDVLDDAEAIEPEGDT